MPEIKNYEGKKKAHHTHHSKTHSKKETHVAKHTEKRRPHNEAETMMAESEEIQSQAQVVIEEAEAINTEAQNEGIYVDEEIKAEAEMVSEGGPAFGSKPSEGHERTKTHLEFYGSELIRQKAPKVMELADTVADEWVHDGQFEGLPVGHPLAQIAAAKALRTAKDVEKKLEEKGVIAMAKMGLEFVKSKIEKKH